jgi:hypothetical protein
MPLFAPEDLNPEDRLTYRRWVGGLFATYGALSMIFCSVIFYQTVVSPRQPHASGVTADASPIDAVGSLPVRQAVKHD